MAEFDDETKFRVVQALARFKTPVEIMEALAEEGIIADHKQVGMYDPTRSYFKAGDRWRKIFEEERESYRNSIKEIPIANQAWRLEKLQETAQAAIKSKNRMLLNQTMRQAAEEVGGALTNERVNRSSPLKELSAEERRAMAADLVGSLLAQTDPKPANAPAPAMKQ